MGARQRLNSLYVIGILVIAGIIGSLAHSWTVFFVAAGVLLAASIHGGDIRVSPTSSHTQSRRKPSRRRKP